MSTVLITGKTSLFSAERLESIADDNTVVISGADAVYDGKVKNIHAYKAVPSEERFTQLFDVYNFDAVWYISGYADGGEGSFGEMKMLDSALADAAKAKTAKFILLSTVETQNTVAHYSSIDDTVTYTYPDSRVFNAAQMEDMGHFYAHDKGLKVVTLWIPYVIDDLNIGNSVSELFRNVYEQKPIVFPHHRDDRIELLSARDLADLLLEITDETDDETAGYFAVSGYPHTYGDLEDALLLIEPKLKVEYKEVPCEIRFPDYPSDLRRRYGFVPLYDMLPQIGVCYKRYVEEVYEKKKSIASRIAKWLWSDAFKYIELILLFFLTEWIADFTSSSVYFRFVDVRLAFIMIMGCVHGIKLGIAAAVMEAVILVLNYFGMGISGTLLFYNIENWIPFIVYLMAGVIPGYVRDKAQEEIKETKGEYDLLRDKYLFLSSAYRGAIQNKSDFKRQILGFKDSFGKIFNAVQKLDDELPQSVFLDGLRVMEDILENRSVAIYTVDQWQRFGRLVACSGSMLSRLSVSLPLEQYSDMVEAIRRGEVWRNVDLLPGQPMYACGVFRDGNVVLFVLLWEASGEQHTVSYINIFKILCGLVQTSFLRAMEYEQLQHDRNTVEGTRAVTSQRFAQLLAVQEELKQAGAAEYMLLRFENPDAAEVSEQLTGLVRASDTLGIGEDGAVYLLLTQVSNQTFGIVGKRLDDRGIAYRIVEKVGV